MDGPIELPRTSRPRRKKTGAGLSNGQAAKIDFEGDLYAFAELLANLHGPTTIDLGGRTVTGDLPDEIDEVALSRTGLRVKNGKLLLPAGVSLVIRPRERRGISRRSSCDSSSSFASSALSSLGGWPRASPSGPSSSMRLEGLTVEGTGGAVGIRDRALILVEERSRVTMDRCKIIVGTKEKAEPFVSTAGLLLRSGGWAHLVSCQIGCRAGPGVHVRDFSTEASLQDCRVRDCEGPCIMVSQSASVRLNQCLVEGSRLGQGSVAKDQGSRIVAKSCHFLSNRLQAMLVLEGARSEMLMCEIQGSAEGAAIEVSGKKSRLNMHDSRMTGAFGCLFVGGGGQADVEGTLLEGSVSGPGSRVMGAGTQVLLSGCALEGNGGPGLEVLEGAAVILRDCLIENNNRAGQRWGASGRLPSVGNAVVSGAGSKVVIGDGVEIGIGGGEAITELEGGEAQREEALSGDWAGFKMLVGKVWSEEEFGHML